MEIIPPTSLGNHEDKRTQGSGGSVLVSSGGLDPILSLSYSSLTSKGKKNPPPNGVENAIVSPPEQNMLKTIQPRRIKIMPQDTLTEHKQKERTPGCYQRGLRNKNH